MKETEADVVGLPVGMVEFEDDSLLNENSNKSDTEMELMVS